MFRNVRKRPKCGFKWVFRSARKPLGNPSNFDTCHDGVGGSNSVWEVVARFSLFYKQNGAFWVRWKAKKLILVSKIILTDPYVTSRDLHGRKLYKIGVSSRLCSMQALGSTQRNRFTQTSLSKVCSMYWQKYKSQIVGLCSSNNF